MRRRLPRLWALGLACAACSGESNSPKTSADGSDSASSDAASAPGLRAAHDAWMRLDAADDPYHQEGMDEVECSPVGWEAESGFFEIESDLCSRATWEQELIAPLQEGDTLTFLFWHLDLWADPPYEASVELTVDSSVLWRYEVGVPSAENVEEVEVAVPSSVPQGVPVRLHLDNHGVNSWRLGDIGIDEG